MKTIFVTERPTQIITALAICDQLQLGENAHVIVANCFDDADHIVKRFGEVEVNTSFELVSNYEEAIERAAKEMPAHLFIHWDVGFGTQKRLRRLREINKDKKISVFEEGVGTYRQDIYPPLKRKIFGLLGLPINIGGSKYVDEIYVYDKRKYTDNARVRPKEIIEISNSLESIISGRWDRFNYIFSNNCLGSEMEKNSGSDCLIYLSNWSFGECELRGFLQKNGLKILKLHPYCKVQVDANGILVAPKSLPAEILIGMATRLFNAVTVYHRGSSVPLYIKHKNVKFMQIEVANDQ